MTQTQRRSSGSVLPLQVEQDDHEVSYGSGLHVSETKQRRNSKRHDDPFDSNTDDSSGLIGESSTSYWAFISTNRKFQLYLLSYVANHMGEWLTYLASLSAIESIQYSRDQIGTSGVAVSRLIIIRLLPNVILSPFGGVLADGRDRREVMIALDLAGAVTAWLFILAIQLESIPIIYIATFLQECLSGLYEPSRSAIVPLIVADQDDLKKATTISGIVWSAVAAFGSATGGFLVAILGMRACYLIDSMTYVASALLMTMMGGKYNVATEDLSDSPMEYVKGMILDGVRYLRSTFFGTLVLLKASNAIVYGGFDVLNVAFAERGSLEGRSFRLGLLFSAVGVGCWVGPLLFDRYTDMSKPKTLQQSCIYSIALAALGSICVGVFNQFWIKCFFSALRALGASVLWIYSSLLLQKFSAPSMLGRVSSVDYALALSTEAFSAYLVGRLQDYSGMSSEQISLLLGWLGVVILTFWAVYHFRGGGAAGHMQDGANHEMVSGVAENLSSPSEKTALLHNESRT